MDREGGYKGRMRKFSLHFLILSPFPLRFLFISSFSLHFLAARLQGCNHSCSPGRRYFPSSLRHTGVFLMSSGAPCRALDERLVRKRMGCTEYRLERPGIPTWALKRLQKRHSPPLFLKLYSKVASFRQ